MSKENLINKQPFPRLEMSDYSIQPVQICYDPNRCNGRFYARVHVEKKTTTHPATIDRGELTQKRTHNIEVILNGPGKSKAEKKIRRQLYSYGIQGRGHSFPVHIRFEEEVKVFPLRERTLPKNPYRKDSSLSVNSS